jgi:hypothetical protein
MLSDPTELTRDWRIRFQGSAPHTMQTFAFQTRPKSQVEFLAVTVPKGGRPAAWLIYFRHTAQRKHFSGDLLELGGGDYLLGRMQVCAQIAASGKNVGAIIPIGHMKAGEGEFANNQTFAAQCIAEVEANLYGSSRPNVPLLGACNSDSIFSLNNFINKCPALRARLKAIYDFDGSFRIGTSGISLAVRGARSFRYVGFGSPKFGSIRPPETEGSFLFRQMSANRVPLALSRWRRHRDYKALRPADDESKPITPDNEVKNVEVDGNWLHHRIPACMLHHGLASTTGI